MVLITPEKSWKILEDIVYSNRENFGDMEGTLEHFHMTGRKAQEIAEKLGLNTEEINRLTIAGYFHDIGRCFTKDKKNHTFHEIVGARYLEAESMELGLTAALVECYKLASLIRPHFLVYEQFTISIPEFEQWKLGLSDTNPKLLLPRELNQKIIIYADLTNKNGKFIPFEQRMEDLKRRDLESHNPRLKAIEKGESRLYTIKKEIELLLS